MATKLTRTKTCKACSSTFTAQRVDAQFCSVACRSTKARAKAKRQTKDERFATDRLCTVLAAQCRRAGTVEVLGKPAEIDLIALDDLTAFARSCNGWDNGTFEQTWDVCHMSPVKGLGTVGLFHPRNLYVGQSSYNKSTGTTDYDIGRNIERSELAAKWKVTPDTTPAQLEAMLRKYIPKAELERLYAHRPTKVNGIEGKRRELAKWQAELVALDPAEDTMPNELRRLLLIDTANAPRAEITEVHAACRDLLGIQRISRAATAFLTVVAQEAARLAAFASGGRKRCLLQLVELVRLFDSRRDGWSPLATFSAETIDAIESEAFEVAVMDLFHGDHSAFHYDLEDLLSGITLHAFEQGRPLHNELNAVGQVAPFEMSAAFKASADYRWGTRLEGPKLPATEVSQASPTPRGEPRWKTQMVAALVPKHDPFEEVTQRLPFKFTFRLSPASLRREIEDEERRKAELAALATDESPFD